MASVMSPSILILPDMKACMGFSEPLSMPSQSSDDTVMVAPGLSWVPLLTKSPVLPFVQVQAPLAATVAGDVELVDSVGLGGRVGVCGGFRLKLLEELSCGFH